MINLAYNKWVNGSTYLKLAVQGQPMLPPALIWPYYSSNTNLTRMEPASLPVHIHEHHNAYLHLWVDSEVKLLYTEWLVRPTIEEYQEAAALFLQYLQQYKVEYWFMDSNRLGGLSLEEQRKVIQQLASAVAASSLKKVARIISQDAGNRVMFEETVLELRNQYQASVEIQQFWTYNEAANWITVILA